MFWRKEALNKSLKNLKKNIDFRPWRTGSKLFFSCFKGLTEQAAGTLTFDKIMAGPLEPRTWDNFYVNFPTYHNQFV